MYVLWLECAQAICVCMCQDWTSLCYRKWISKVSVIESIKCLFLNWHSAPGHLFSRWSRVREKTDSGPWAPLAEALRKEERLKNLLESPFFGLKLTLLICYHPWPVIYSLLITDDCNTPVCLEDLRCRYGGGGNWGVSPTREDSKLKR